MNLSNLKIFFRNLQRNKLYTAITVSGFAFSMAFVILLSVYIHQELSVDNFHSKKDRIYRAIADYGSYFGTLVGGELASKYPEIESYTRIFQQNVIVTDEQGQKSDINILMADSSFFNIFSFRLLEGDPDEVLCTAQSIVLTRSYARKLFGNGSALGQEVELDEQHRLKVTGIMEDLPKNTHFNACDAVVNFEYLARMWGSPELLKNNDNNSFGLYFLTKPGTDLISKIPRILTDFKESYWIYKSGIAKIFDFQPLKDIYFSEYDGVATHGNSKVLVSILTAIVVIIFLLALINYNNLSMARAGFRAKEAAVKKMLGAGNTNLYKQFIGESVWLCMLAFIIAAILAVSMEPLFNTLLETEISIKDHFSLFNLIGILGFVVLTGIVAGIMPAWMVTRFNSVEVVKGMFHRKSKSVYGKVLICFQFVVTIVLIIGTLVIRGQTDYMRNYYLGFDKENVIWLTNRINYGQDAGFRSELSQLPEVKSCTFSSGAPGFWGDNNTFESEGKWIGFTVYCTDTAFFSVFNIPVTPTGITGPGVYLNRTAVKNLELEGEPTSYKRNGRLIPILGIMDDFHFAGFKEAMGPLEVSFGNRFGRSLILVRVTGNPIKAYERVKSVYAKFIEGRPYGSGFLDDRINLWYKEGERTASLVGIFCLLAVMLSMMGILAMSTYFIQQRLREIGLRRVNGASIREVLRMLISGFLRWILFAFVIACPIGWWATDYWLSGYVYRIGISWWIFVVAGVFACIVALLMVGWQSYKAATLNPVHSLKSE